MDLQEKLSKLKMRVEGNMPKEYVDIMHAATKSLEESGIKDIVLKVGDKMPEFELQNQNGEIIKSSVLYSTSPLIITFYRGFWCPYCNTDLAYLNNYVNEAEQLGAKMIAISPEKTEYSNKIIKSQNLKFDILMDQSNKVAEKFGLKFHLPNDLIGLYRDGFNINLPQLHNDTEWTLPMPGRFLVDTNGIIKYAEATPDYTTRPNPDEIMNVLRSF